MFADAGDDCLFKQKVLLFDQSVLITHSNL